MFIFVERRDIRNYDFFIIINNSVYLKINFEMKK